MPLGLLPSWTVRINQRSSEGCVWFDVFNPCLSDSVKTLCSFALEFVSAPPLLLRAEWIRWSMVIPLSSKAVVVLDLAAVSILTHRSREYISGLKMLRDLDKASQVLPFSAGYQNPKTISVGPWGGKGGNSWYDGVYDGIRQIRVVYGDVIDSIDIEYQRNGAPVSSKHGGRGGNNSEKIELDYPNERITSISGHYDTHVRSLTFESNAKKIYGPYGVEDGTYFSFSIAEGEIVGFHGRSDGYLVCIGVYISPFSLQAPAISKILKPISVGPWGGKGGDMWDDGVYSGIHQIIVVYGDAIDSIKIQYDNNGSPFWLEHGRSTQNKKEKIQLDYSTEILTSISGHYDTYLRSLTFKSNLKKYGPYGRQQGTYFSFPISDGKIVGFHGRSGSYLDCIGVYLSNLHTAVPPKSNTVISVAPWGGEGGDRWDDGACEGVRQIILVHGEAIHSIQIEYERDGSSVWSSHGGTGGTKTNMIILDYPRESLISISGHYVDNYLRSLCFESNLKKYGPYGVEQGTYFSFPITEGRIVGFHGKSGQYLDSIGVYISNLHYSIPSQALKTPESELVDHAGLDTVVLPSDLHCGSNTLISIGPWGGKGGYQWDDGACAGVRQIILVHGEAIDSIQIEYERDGRSVWSRHGGRGGNKTDRIILDYPRESLISISGHYVDNYLRSLCFESNLKKYGPYGVEQGTYFSFPITEGRIVGFHGKSGRYLDSIGVYISNLHYSIPSQSISAGPWGGNGGDGWCDGEYRGIRQIILVHGQFIGSINIEYEKDGRFVWSKHGGVGTKTDKIKLDYPKESLTSISGYYDISLTSLTFESNYGKIYGPYGVKRGTYFSFPTKGKIVSFHGRSGCYLDCIGVYLSNLHAPNPPKSIEPISVGPWGGQWPYQAERMWDDGVWSGIHQIMITHREFIDSIDIEYDRDGTRVWLTHRSFHPSAEREGKTDTIELDYPREYLISLSGHYERCPREYLISLSGHYERCVTSLTFQSNLRIFGPYGKQGGTYFSVPVFKGKIVGFHGRSGWSLDRLGVYLSTSQTQNLETHMNFQSIEPISVGPWGGEGGQMWDDGVWSGIHQIMIAHGEEFIDSIDIEYDRDGTRVWLTHRGEEDPSGKRGDRVDKIELDYPREYLISLSGHYERCVTSLTFESNLRKYGPYGKQGGIYFSVSRFKGKMVGFYGRSGSSLDRLGVYFSTSQTENLETQMNSQSIEPISVGPWGGEGGQMWDDGVWSGIHQIMIAHGEEFIDSIDIEYDRDGTRVWLTHRGEDPSAKRGDKTDKIEVDYPREYLTSLSGHHERRASGQRERCVTSLTFESNLRKYGPYGKQRGTYFSVSLSKGKIVGFYGRSGLSLDSLGVYLSTSQTQNLETQMNSQSIEPISVGPWGGEWPYEEGRMWDDGVWSGIHQIMITHGEYIDSIDIEYDRDGTRVWLTHRSQDPSAKPGDKTDKIELDYPREYLTSLSGRHERRASAYFEYFERCVTSLTFESNLRKYGPYGKQRGTYFSVSLSKGKIVGFYGRSGLSLDRLGVYLSTSQTQNLETQMNSQMWDDGVWSGIHQIMIAHGEEFIDSIDIEYDREGTRVWLTHPSQDPSAKPGDKTDKIELDYPREYLTSLSGRYGRRASGQRERCVTSLTFESNLRKYGPYGKQRGTYFSVSLSKGKIVGFYGWEFICQLLKPKTWKPK